MPARSGLSRSICSSLVACSLVSCGNLMGYDDIEFADEAGSSQDSGSGRDAGTDGQGSYDPLSWQDSQEGASLDQLAPDVSTDASSTECGDGVCSGEETCESCAEDCGDCPPVPVDCGNGACGAGEDCANCPSDCGACPPTCGNGACEAGEDCANCPSDCGACPPACGNGACEAGEDCANCLSDCGACPPACGNGVCETGEDCANCPSDCGACPVTVTHETEFLTWNLHNDAGCVTSGGVAKWLDRDDGPGALSIRDTLLGQNPSILALQEDGKLGPDSCSLGSIKDKVAAWLASTHDVQSTDDVAGSASGERLGIFIRKSKYRFITAGYQPCYYGGSEVRGFLWAEVDLIEDNTSNHFYVLNTHFKAFQTAEAIAERKAQAQCVMDWVATRKSSHPNRAHFLLGDLNSGPDHNHEAYSMLTSGPFENTSNAAVDDINTHGDHWIDHVLGTKGDFAKAGYGSWTVGAGQVQSGGTLSDHLGLRTRIGHVR